MNRVFDIAKFILVLSLLIKGVYTYGQHELRLSYVCEDEIKGSFRTEIRLKHPDNKTSYLFTDTVRKYKVSEKNYLKLNGKYTLSIWFDAKNYGKDSLNYDFNVNGNELVSDISIRFDYDERLIKKGGTFTKDSKVVNGYIRINKYFNAPKSVEILLDKEDLGDEYYKGPFFKIKNCSNDTLYGEHLPDYFWGTLSYVKNDSVLATRTGIIDYEFISSHPLYPDSTKYATVGSFGLNRKLAPFKYRFEVLLAKKWQSQGIDAYKEQQNISWWAETKEYYKLVYDFVVNE